MRSCGLWSCLTALILQKVSGKAASFLPQLCSTGLGESWRRIFPTHTVERPKGQTWVAGTLFTALFYFWIGATPCHTSLHPGDARTAHLREVSCLPVCCVPLAVTALCLLNTLGRWPVSQNPHDWKTFYLDTIPCYQQPKETGLKDTLPDNTWRSSAMLSSCPHPPQSNHWPLSNALGLGFSCLAQRTSSCLTVTAGCAVWVFHLPWSKILAQTSQSTDEEVT